MIQRTFRCSPKALPLIASVLSLAGQAASQASRPSVLLLDKDYHVGDFGSELLAQPSGCAFYSAIGSASFLSDGTFQGNNILRVVSGPGTSTLGTFSTVGTYHVELDGQLKLLASNDTQRYFIKPDGSMFFGAQTELYPDAWISIGLEKSSGQSEASLQGSYSFAGILLAHLSNGPLIQHLRGSYDFDGAGSFGQGGYYTVAPDGRFSFGTNANGGISADGNAWFIVITTQVYVGLLVGVKGGTTSSAEDVRGDWAFIGVFRNSCG